jgi:hypothetical protein
VHTIFDSRDVNNLLVALVVPLLPLAMSVWGWIRWANVRKRGAKPKVSVTAFAVVTAFIFVSYAWFFWWNSWLVEHDYAVGRTRVAEGQINGYQASPDGKDVSFVIGGVHFSVSCCDPRPIYRGTPTVGALSPDLLHEGMCVRITYLVSGEIVRIQTTVWKTTDCGSR